MRKGLTASVVVAAICLAACDATKALNTYFQDVGLNRLAMVRDDIQPGALIVSDKKNSLYANSMFDYTVPEAGGSIPLTATVEDRTADFNAALSKYSSERVMQPSAALGFIGSILPVDISGDLKFSAAVQIDLQNVKGQRLSIKSIEDYLASSSSRPLRDKVLALRASNSGYSAYVVYEILRSNKMAIKTTDGSDIDASLKVGEIKPVSKAELGLVYKKTKTSELELAGDRYYVFAVRVGALVPGGGMAGVRFDQLNFKVPGGTIKAVSDDSYSALVTAGEKAMVLQRGPEAAMTLEKLGLR